MTMLDTIGGRKFILALLSLACATAVQAYGKLDPSGTTYLGLVLGIIGGYIYGNVKSKEQPVR